MEEDNRQKADGILESRYSQEEKHYEEFSIGGTRESHAKTWLNQDNIGSWRHECMYSLIDPILEVFPEATWLTVGDGRYGKDANYIKRKGLNVVASDISDLLLREASANGYIDAYSRQNAEALTFSDNEFDFVLCKESYHHFPRPMIALYEMLRVASRGVILIEPVDRLIYTSIIEALLGNIKSRVRKMLHKTSSECGYEIVGNYIYTLSKREIEKVALGMNYKAVANKGMNSYYVEGVEYEKATPDNLLFRKVKQKNRMYNILTTLKLRQYSISSFVIIKDNLTSELQAGFIGMDYELNILPENPYQTG